MPTYYDLGWHDGYDGTRNTPPHDIVEAGIEAEDEWYDGYNDGVLQLNIDTVTEYDYYDDAADFPDIGTW